MTLLIKNVQIVSEAKKFPDRVDVFISGKKISAIGLFPEKRADRVIEGQGAYCSAGFIDADTTSDHYLTIFHDPGQEDFLRQGVTSIAGGHCGASLAPLLYGTLESIRKWGDEGAVSVDWHTMGEFFSTIERASLGVNFGTCAGHSTIRRALIGESIRDLTENELNVFGCTLSRAFEEGALGFSAGLEYAHSRLTPYGELRFLLDLAAKKKRMFSLHARKTGKGVSGAAGEAIALAKDTGVRVLLTHLVPLKGSEAEYGAMLETLDALPENVDFHFSVYSFAESIIPAYRLLPEWAQNGSLETMKANVDDESMWERIEKDFPPLDPELLTILGAQNASPLAGRTFTEVMELYSLSTVAQVVRRLLLTTTMRAVVQYKNIDGELLDTALAHPRSIVASHAPSIGDHFVRDAFRGNYQKPDRSTATFASFLIRALQGKTVSLQEAIQKITKLPARILGLERRGSVREGYFADLAIFSSAGEMKYVIVNGEVAVDDGTITEKRAGMPLRVFS